MQAQYIAHHGIKGQKWGVRRYQNVDGHLTEAGKIRYNKDLRSAVKLHYKIKKRKDKAKGVKDDVRKAKMNLKIAKDSARLDELKSGFSKEDYQKTKYYFAKEQHHTNVQMRMIGASAIAAGAALLPALGPAAIPISAVGAVIPAVVAPGYDRMYKRDMRKYERNQG